jgi:hypothetical protein
LTVNGVIAPARGACIAVGLCLWLAAQSDATAQSVADDPPATPGAPAATSAPQPTEPKRVRTIPIRPDTPEPTRSVPLAPQPGTSVETKRVRTLGVRPGDDAAARPAVTYVVQVSAQRSEDAALAAYRALQQKYPTVLGGREPVIRKAELANAGTWYRAQIGPFGTPGKADGFCLTLKAAGGACIVQRY